MEPKQALHILFHFQFNPSSKPAGSSQNNRQGLKVGQTQHCALTLTDNSPTEESWQRYSPIDTQNIFTGYSGTWLDGCICVCVAMQYSSESLQQQHTLTNAHTHISEAAAFKCHTTTFSQPPSLAYYILKWRGKATCFHTELCNCATSAASFHKCVGIHFTSSMKPPTSPLQV